MKTYKNLYPQIYDFENLYLAFRAARKGKRSRVDVATLEDYVQALNYVKASGFKLGLLWNFGARRLQIKRLVN